MNYEVSGVSVLKLSAPGPNSGFDEKKSTYN